MVLKLHSLLELTPSNIPLSEVIDKVEPSLDVYCLRLEMFDVFKKTALAGQVTVDSAYVDVNPGTLITEAVMLDETTWYFKTNSTGTFGRWMMVLSTALDNVGVYYVMKLELTRVLCMQFQRAVILASNLLGGPSFFEIGTAMNIWRSVHVGPPRAFSEAYGYKQRSWNKDDKFEAACAKLEVENNVSVSTGYFPTIWEDQLANFTHSVWYYLTKRPEIINLDMWDQMLAPHFKSLGDKLSSTVVNSIETQMGVLRAVVTITEKSVENLNQSAHQYVAWIREDPLLSSVVLYMFLELVSEGQFGVEGGKFLYNLCVAAVDLFIQKQGVVVVYGERPQVSAIQFFLAAGRNFLTGKISTVGNFLYTVGVPVVREGSKFILLVTQQLFTIPLRAAVGLASLLYNLIYGFPVRAFKYFNDPKNFEDFWKTNLGKIAWGILVSKWFQALLIGLTGYGIWETVLPEDVKDTIRKYAGIGGGVALAVAGVLLASNLSSAAALGVGVAKSVNKKRKKRLRIKK